MPALIPPDVVLAIHPARLRALVVLGGMRALAKQKRTLAIAHALFVGEVTKATAALFADVVRLAHDDGCAALVEAASAVDHPVDALVLDLGAADLAAEIVLRRAKHRWARSAIVRARIRVDRFFVPRATYELAALPATRRRLVLRGEDDAIGAILGTVLGRSHRATWFAREGDCTHVAVLFDAPAIVETEWRSGHPARVVVRPVRADILRIDDAALRLTLSTSRPQHLDPFAEAIGFVLYGDRAFYSFRPSLSFKRLQEIGARGFAALALPRGVEAWSIVGCQWDAGEERHEVRSRDALASLEARVHVDGGYFSRLTVRVHPRGADCAVDVAMQLPHRITFSDPRFESVARAAVAELGVFAPGVIPDDVQTLAPWVQPEWRWSEVVGADAFAEMMRAKLVTRVKTSRVATEAYRALGRSAKVNPVPGENVHYATTDDFSIAARDVGERELEMWQLDVAVLAARMREAMGLRAVARGEGIEPIEGVVDIGVLGLKNGKVRVLYAMSRARKGLVAAIRKGCSVGVTPVMLVPDGRTITDEGIQQIELAIAEQLGTGNVGHVVGRIARALGIEDEIDLWRLASPDEIVVIDRKTERVWIDGVLMTKLWDNAFRLLEKLASSPGAIVPPKELGAYVSPGAGYPDVVVRRTCARLRTQVQASFKAAGRRVPEWLIAKLVIVEGRRGYRLGVGAMVR